MDMSVSVGAAGNAKNQEKFEPAKAQARAPNSSDLDTWLEKVEALGELKRITAEVDPDLEAATITYLVGLEKSPALLFENIKGHPGHRALYNMIGCNLSRFCLMIGEEPVDHPLQAVQLLQKKLGRKMAPVTVPAESAVSSQNIVESTSLRSETQATDSTCAGCAAKSAATIALFQKQPVILRKTVNASTEFIR